MSSYARALNEQLRPRNGWAATPAQWMSSYARAMKPAYWMRYLHSWALHKQIDA